MTLREELIEAGARAVWVADQRRTGVSLAFEALGAGDKFQYFVEAVAALDAFLDVLEARAAEWSDAAQVAWKAQPDGTDWGGKEWGIRVAEVHAAALRGDA